jgi:hypothetical protein
MVLKIISPGIRHITKCLILFFVTSCSDSRQAKESIAMIWKDSVATGISVSRELLGQVQADSLKAKLTFHLLTSSHAGPPVLGSYTIHEGEVVFEPLIPFTRGLQYEIRFGGKRLGEITVPPAGLAGGPQLLGIFPTQDTLPQNLLKFYLRFSKPMQEGQSLQYLTLLKNGRDTMHQVFLDLQPELWDHDGTLLTIWLDPGRIKRGLQPNENLGEPLESGAHYQLAIGHAWKDVHGTPLLQPYRKNFVVSLRDTVSPAPEQWAITIPEAGTRKPLRLNFYEPLDHVLVGEAIRIYKGDEHIGGNIETTAEESVCHFLPGQPWQEGDYTIRSEARLEDLAGNNLDRVFDRDVSKERSVAARDGVYVRKFTVGRK